MAAGTASAIICAAVTGAPPARNPSSDIESLSSTSTSRLIPEIPGVTYNGLMTTGDLFDYGPFFSEGTGEGLCEIISGAATIAPLEVHPPRRR